MAPRQDPRAIPLRPPVFHILLALSGGDLHGLGIAEQVESASGGTVELGPGTLYRSLAEMADAGLVRQVRPPGSRQDPRRRYYRVTPAGKALVAAEARRLQQLVTAARARNVLTDPT
jgi:DNA-binding PadR family transcriptional regulator